MERIAHPGPQLEQVRALFLEYASELGFSLCFQGFADELAQLPGAYRPPRGALLLEPDRGCVGLRGIDSKPAEMKRLYVRPGARGSGLGRRLALAAMAEAKERGYERIVLDTIAGTMDPAIALYRALGFQQIAPYYQNPIPRALYLEASLR
jgi:putative acetyltransferase